MPSHKEAFDNHTDVAKCGHSEASLIRLSGMKYEYIYEPPAVWAPFLRLTYSSNVTLCSLNSTNTD